MQKKQDEIQPTNSEASEVWLDDTTLSEIAKDSGEDEEINEKEKER